MLGGYTSLYSHGCILIGNPLSVGRWLSNETFLFIHNPSFSNEFTVYLCDSHQLTHHLDLVSKFSYDVLEMGVFRDIDNNIVSMRHSLKDHFRWRFWPTRRGTVWTVYVNGQSPLHIPLTKLSRRKTWTTPNSMTSLKLLIWSLDASPTCRTNCMDLWKGRLPFLNMIRWVINRWRSCSCFRCPRSSSVRTSMMGCGWRSQVHASCRTSNAKTQKDSWMF